MENLKRIVASFFFLILLASCVAKTVEPPLSLPVDTEPHLDTRLFPMEGLLSAVDGNPNVRYPAYHLWYIQEHELNPVIQDGKGNEEAWAHIGEFVVRTRYYTSPTNEEALPPSPSDTVRMGASVIMHDVVRTITRGFNSEEVYTADQLGCDPKNLLKCRMVGTLRAGDVFYLVLGQQVLRYHPFTEDPTMALRFTPAYQLGPGVVISRKMEHNGVSYFPLVYTKDYKEGDHYLAGVLYVNPLTGAWTRVDWNGHRVHGATRMQNGTAPGLINVVTKGYRRDDPEETVILNVLDGSFVTDIK